MPRVMTRKRCRIEAARRVAECATVLALKEPDIRLRRWIEDIADSLTRRADRMEREAERKGEHPCP